MNKKQKTEAARRILYGYPLGSTVSVEADIEFLSNLFQSHPEWSIKEGPGVLSIGIMSGQYGTRLFTLRRVDGSTTDISFVQCINGKTTKISDVKAGCRQAIRPTIEQYKLDNFRPGVTRCAVTDEVLYEGNVHVDHYDLPFNDLFKMWVADKSVNVLFERLNNTAVDHETRIYFTDPLVEKDFIDFHNANTHLRLVSKTANLSLLRKKNP